MKKEGGAALMLIPGGKGEPDEGSPAEEEKDVSDEDSLAANAYQALKEDDEEGFKRSLKAAIRACVDSYGEE